MVNYGPLYLHTNALAGNLQRDSGASSPVRGPIDDSLASGLATLDTGGGYNWDEATNFALRVTAITGLSTPPHLTTPLPGASNVGNGTLTAEAASTNESAETWVATCIHSGEEETSATGESADYTELEAAGEAKGIKVVARDAGADGNNYTVQISKCTAPAHAWTWADTGLTVDGDVAAPVGYQVYSPRRIYLSADPTAQLGDGSLVTFHATDPDVAAEAIGVYRVTYASSGMEYIEVMRSNRGIIASGLKVWRLASTAGYTVTVTDSVGGTTEVFDRAGVGMPIRTTNHVMYVLQNGGQYWDGAAWQAQLSTLVQSDTDNGGDYAPKLETAALGNEITLSGGTTIPVGEGYATFQVHSGPYGATVLADGTAYSVPPTGADTHKIWVTITQGDIRFAADDEFRFSTAYAQFELSTDGGLSYDGTYLTDPDGTELLRGITMLWDAGQYDTSLAPWVVGDVWRWRNDYDYSADRLLDGDRDTFWRTPGVAVPHTAIFATDAEADITVEGVWVLDDNISATGSLYLAGSSVKPYGTASSVGAAGTVVDDTWSGPVDQFAGGYLIATTGAARGLGWVITSNSTDGTFNVTGDPSGDGMLAGDHFALIDPDPDVKILLNDAGTGIDRDGYWTTTSYSKPYWSIVAWDPSGGESYTELSCLFVGVPVQTHSGPSYRADYRLPVFALQIEDGPGGRRRINRYGVERTRITHDYSDQGQSGVSAADHAILLSVKQAAWATTIRNVAPTIIVEDDSDPGTFDLADLVEIPSFALIMRGQYADVLVFETREQSVV